MVETDTHQRCNTETVGPKVAKVLIDYSYQGYTRIVFRTGGMELGADWFVYFNTPLSPSERPSNYYDRRGVQEMIPCHRQGTGGGHLALAFT